MKLAHQTKDGPLHYTVAALIEQDGKYLLIDRAKPPLGWGCVAEHVEDTDATLEDAIRRGLREELGLRMLGGTVVHQKIEDATCHDGTVLHQVAIFNALVEGTPQPDPAEVRRIGYFSRDEIKRLPLTPFWKNYFG